MSDKAPLDTCSLGHLMQMVYRFPNQKYEPLPDELKTVEGIKKAIASRWISVYGIKTEDDEVYTMAFADENHDGCYVREGFSESEVWEILNTKDEDEV